MLYCIFQCPTIVVHLVVCVGRRQEMREEGSRKRDGERRRGEEWRKTGKRREGREGSKGMTANHNCLLIKYAIKG